MQELPDWEKLNKIGDVEDLETTEAASDSAVFRVKNYKIDTVAKEYDKLNARVGPEVIKEILQHYYADTEKAQSLLEKNPNPLNQAVNINNKKYSIHYIIVPQGGLMLENSNYSYNNPIVISQSFVDGLNLKDLYQGRISSKELVLKLDEIKDEQKTFYKNEGVLNNISSECSDLFDYLNGKLDTYFIFASMNIKPFLKQEESKIEIFITDLAGSLALYHDYILIRKYEKE